MSEINEPGGIVRRSLLRGVLPAAGGLLLIAGGARAARAEQAAKVTIDNFAFTPAALTVPKGTTVTWTNRDDIPHLVVCPSIKMRSHVLDTDQSFAFRFDQPGRVDYFCALHPQMTGSVTVTG